MRSFAAILACTLFLPSVSLAHDAGISYSELTVKDDCVGVSLRMAERDVAVLESSGGLPSCSGQGICTERASALLSMLQIARGDARCIQGRAFGTPEPPDGVRVTGSFQCPRPGRLRVRTGLLASLPWGHTHLAQLSSDGTFEQFVLRASRDGFEAQAGPSWCARAARFLRLGIEHIFTGYDHIAFLLGLLLISRTLKDLVKVVTSFTAAHSITLALASLELVQPPMTIVEPLIAASIVCVAAENLCELRWPSPRRMANRWQLGFAFGLVHGFGFAGALRELFLSRGDLVMALFSFNAGVEIGQGLIVALVLPLLMQLRHGSGRALAGLAPGSVAIGAAGIFWLIQRLVA